MWELALIAKLNKIDYSELSDVARIKGLSAAAALQRLSSHPKAIGIGMRISKRKAWSLLVPAALFWIERGD